ncbi:hypothetical protein [Endozoicomonas sp. ONNA2]|uniref:hypothetical protein n=1 Tax=Endozoicomonas sp. ONNA2 TaxID=2828741 RepID=UPI0021489CB2|nr:hypothetical protein [Endozoicomonas sp. ONNA2]
MNPSDIIGAPGCQATSRSENTAPRRIRAIWHTITGPFRCVSSTTNDGVLPDNQRFSSTPSTDLKVRDVKGSSSGPLDLPGTGGHAKVFKEVVRRIKTDQQSLIMDKVNDITPQQLEQIAQCCRNPEEITTKHRCFLQSDTFAYAALRAFREKKISRNEFATLVTLQGVYLEGEHIKPFEIVHHKLFDDKGNVNGVHRDIIFDSLVRSKGFFLPSSFDVDSFDVDSILSNMLRLLENASPVEAGFWSCKYPTVSGEDKGQITIKKALSSRHFNVLFIDCEWSGWMICPSITLRQAFIDSFCQNEAHIINPVIGISSPEDIRTGSLKRYRDMAIPFPGHPLPKIADYLSARLILEFMQHDFYHAVRASMLKNADIDLIIAIAGVVRKIQMAFGNEYARVKGLKQRKQSFEGSIFDYPRAQQDQTLKNDQKHKNVVSMKNTLEYLKRTRKALGQLAFNLEDLETHKPTWVLHRHSYEEDRFIHHLSNLLLLLNRFLGKPWSELLSETDAGIVGQCIIPMIPGNSNPLKMYNHLCRVIDSEVNHGVKRNLLAAQKQEYVARSKKFIETLNPSVKLDQSQWPTFLREAMIDNAVHIPNSGLINEQNHEIS